MVIYLLKIRMIMLAFGDGRRIVLETVILQRSQ